MLSVGRLVVPDNLHPLRFADIDKAMEVADLGWRAGGREAVRVGEEEDFELWLDELDVVDESVKRSGGVLVVPDLVVVVSCCRHDTQVLRRHNPEDLAARFGEAWR